MQTLIHQNRYSDVSCVYYDVASENRPICGMTLDLSAHLWDRPICGNRPSCGTQPSCESYIFIENIYILCEIFYLFKSKGKRMVMLSVCVDHISSLT